MSDIEILEVSAHDVAASIHAVHPGVHYAEDTHGFDIDDEELRYFVFDDPELSSVDFVMAVRIESAFDEYVRGVKWWVLQGDQWNCDGLPSEAVIYAFGEWGTIQGLSATGLAGIDSESFAADLNMLFERLAIVFKEINCTGVV